MKKVLAVGLFLLVAGHAWAYDATVRVEFVEATVNVDGTPLDDLASSLIEIRNAQNEVIVGPDSIAATNQNGGGTIVKQYTLPVSDTESESYSAVVWHVDTSGNQSAGLGVNFMAGGSDPPPIDTTPPDPPQNLRLPNAGVDPMAFPDNTTLIDAFTGSDEAAINGSIWTAPLGAGEATPKIFENQIYAGGGASSWGSAYVTTPVGPDTAFYVDVSHGNTGQEMYLAARIINPATGTMSGYMISVIKQSGSDTWEIWRVDDAVWTSIAGPSSTVELGTKIGIEIIDDVIRAMNYNGSWAEVLSATDDTYDQAGVIGFHLEGYTWLLDNASGGTVDAGGPTPIVGSESIAIAATESVTAFIDGQFLESISIGLNDSGSVLALGSVAIDQLTHRYRFDDGSEATATWREAQGAHLTLVREVPVRLRVQLDVSGNPTSKAFRKEYRRKRTGEQDPWRIIS